MRRRERIPGGLAEGRDPSDFDPRQLAAGIRVELEHTPDPDVAREIAMDHLVEDPQYYTKLATLGLNPDLLMPFLTDTGIERSEIFETDVAAPHPVGSFVDLLDKTGYHDFPVVIAHPTLIDTPIGAMVGVYIPDLTTATKKEPPGSYGLMDLADFRFTEPRDPPTAAMKKVVDRVKKERKSAMRSSNPLASMPGGSVTGCIRKMERERPDIDDAGAYCAAIADRIEPGWRSKARGGRKRNAESVTAYRVWHEGELVYDGRSADEASSALQRLPVEGTAYEVTHLEIVRNPTGHCPPGSVKMIRVWDGSHLVYEGADERAARRALHAIPFMTSTVRSRCVDRPGRARGEIRAGPRSRFANSRPAGDARITKLRKSLLQER